MDSLRVKQTQMSELIPLIKEKLEQGGTVRFSPMGKSMLPILRPGRDMVILSPLPGKMHKYDIPLYQRDDGKFILHRIVRIRESYTCIGDNQYGVEEGIRHDQMIGIVSAFVRDGKVISVTALHYRIYCWLWCFTRPVRKMLIRCFRSCLS